MSGALIEGFLSNLSTISALPHPYAALADYLTLSAKESYIYAMRPLWAQVLSIVVIVISGLMFMGSLWICAIRFQHKRFTLGSITKDRFVRPDPAMCMAVGSAGYYICEMIQQIAILFTEYNVSNPGGRLTLYGVKFMFMWLAAWCFAWSSVGHHVCNIWDPPWQRNIPQDVKTRVPPLLVCFMNLFFSFLAVAAVIFIFSIFIFIDVEQRKTIDILELVKIGLRDLDRDGAVFDLTKAFVTLQPLISLISLTDNFISHLKIGIAGWISFGFLQALIQVICIYLTMSERRKMGASFKFKETITSIFKTQKENQRTTLIDYRREQSIYLLISLIIISTLVIYMPQAIISYFSLSPEQLQDVKFSLVMELPPSLYVTVITSIYVSLTLSQTLRISKIQRISKSRALQIIQGVPEPQQNPSISEPINSFQITKERVRSPTLSGLSSITHSSLVKLQSPLKVLNNPSTI